MRTSLIPFFVKRPLRRAYNIMLRLVHPRASRDEIHRYWRKPSDDANRPEDYAEMPEMRGRSALLRELVGTRAGDDPNVLEIGCNVGRNLDHLLHTGVRRLTGIEISEPPVKMMRQVYPELASTARILNMPVEDAIKNLGDGEFDLVYTMAVLEHIHPDSEWVFGEMVRVTRNLIITIEDEESVSGRHFPRRYKRIFEPLGMQQIEERKCDSISGFDRSFVARVFVKSDRQSS
jgi:SAM-dependent methyltransferase